LVEKQTVTPGKDAFEEFCCFCHPIERVMVRIRTGAMGAGFWAQKVPTRLRYWKGAWTEQEMDQRVQAIIDYIVELESQYANKDEKGKEKKDEF
jgi:hypothetical protein